MSSPGIDTTENWWFRIKNVVTIAGLRYTRTIKRKLIGYASSQMCHIESLRSITFSSTYVELTQTNAFAYIIIIVSLILPPLSASYHTYSISFLKNATRFWNEKFDRFVFIEFDRINGHRTNRTNLTKKQRRSIPKILREKSVSVSVPYQTSKSSTWAIIIEFLL